MNKFTLMLITLALVFTMISCDESDSKDTASAEDTAVAESLDVIHAQGNNARTMTYQKSTPLVLPDGTTITQGDLKPTWQYIQSVLGFSIVDQTVQDQKGSEMIDIAAATGFD